MHLAVLLCSVSQKAYAILIGGALHKYLPYGVWFQIQTLSKLVKVFILN